MAKKLEQAETTSESGGNRAQLAIQQALGRPQRRMGAGRHTQPQSFRVGQPVVIDVSFEKAPKSVRLYYRHVDQAERYERIDMQAEGGRYRATIPAAYTNSPYPLQYYFDVTESPDVAWLYPGFNAERTNQPYFLVRQA